MQRRQIIIFLVYLPSSPRLKLLYISGPEITDNGLPLLSSVRTLEYVQLHTTSISASTVAEFNQKHSNCRAVLVP